MSARLAGGLAVGLAGCLAAGLLGSCTLDCGQVPGAGVGTRPGTHIETQADSQTNPRPPARAPDRAGVEGMPAVQPRWQVTLPSVPGGEPMAAAWGEHGASHSAGPVLVAPDGERALALVASSAVGFVALDADSGAVRWRHAGEEAPERPVVAASGALWLPGRCARAVMTSVDALGCVTVTDKTGRLVRRVWVRPKRDDGIAVAVRGRRGLVLGRRGMHLLWAHGPDVLAVDMARERIAGIYRAAEGISAEVSGRLALDGAEVIATRDGLMGFAGGAVAGVHAPAWRARAPRAVGVTGPVRAGSLLAWVRDQVLEAGPGPTVSWTARGHYAYAPGSLSALDAERLLAVRTGDGIRPVIIDAASGRIIREGDPAPGIQVLAALSTMGATAGGGSRVCSGMVAAVRLDSSLYRDAVIAWDAALRITWIWHLPVPPRPRVEPVGLAALDGETLVFHDGRHAVRLPCPSMGFAEE